MLADLLTRYSSVFRTGDSDIGRTTPVEQSIPLMKEVQPVRQPPHNLGAEKGAEAYRQLAELLQKGLV